MTTKFEILDNGNLRISWDGTDEKKEEIRQKLETDGSDSLFFEITEHYWANGWGLVNADTLGQMTQCLVISEDDALENDGSRTLYGKSWTNNYNYQVVNPVAEILEKGFIDFEFWMDFGNGENFPNPYCK